MGSGAPAAAGGLGKVGAPAAPRPPFAVGLVNSDGACCFMNATVQAMHACAPLRELLQPRLTAWTVPAVATEASSVVSVFRNTYAALDDITPGAAPYNPQDFVHEVRKASFGVGSGHQDASDFFTRLWTRLQIARVTPNSTPEPDVSVDMHFHGVVTSSRLECQVCGASRTALAGVERSCMLALPLPQARVLSVQLRDLFPLFAAEEMLDGGNAVQCSGKCGGRNTKHSKRLEFSVAPEMQFMILQLKRFTFGGVADTKLSVPLILDASGIVEFADAQGVLHRFRVTAVVVHSGSTGGGHYWTVTPEGVYNDSTVTLDGGAAMKDLLGSGKHKSGAYTGEGYLYFMERV